ncbi:hypothetical protein SAMN05421693_13515 [Ectothiorhodospira magna]|uniref:Uncharacterized protein n=1 Tax=Ectothiorhodospira magna TaxID=867345 RepID=A0A1H9GDQ8_9GAMM|nr:hypothetical protein [Ectothiorhodospira magna]SEQ47918.1 hypothetical protein SAMN05421693_13515 [Ectothiorhodospira magna]
MDEQLQALVDALQGILATLDPVATLPSSSEDLTSILLQLRGYLEENNTRANDLLESHRAQLTSRLGDSGNRLVRLVRDFEYDAALDTLQKILPHTDGH